MCQERVQAAVVEVGGDDAADVVLAEALFASPLQPSDHPGAGPVLAAIRSTIAALGTQGCVARMATEFGDHPETAVARMVWARDAVRRLNGTVRGMPRTALRSTVGGVSETTTRGAQVTTIVTLRNDDNESLTFAMTDDRDPATASQAGRFEITATLTTDGQVVDESIVFASDPGAPNPFGDTQDRLDELVAEYEQDGWTFASRRSIDNRTWTVTVDGRTDSHQGASAAVAAIRAIAEQQGDAIYANMSTVDLHSASTTDRDGRQVWGPIRIGSVDVAATTGA